MRLSGKYTYCGLAAIAAVLATSFIPTSVQSAERTMIVLDGSGSMWGQIDGKPKLQIARETLRDVLKGVPGSTELGLLAYGHRRKGDCGDIELIVPPAPGTGALISDRVDNLKFLGKTPLTAAVQLAAEELRYTEEKATVVLITDGIETCKADICELGKLLESQGVDFTAHVVGFGLSKEEGRQVACLAENTGGQYFSADDGEGLVVALNETVAAPVAPPVEAKLPNVTLVAVDQNQRQLINVALSWDVKDADGNSALQSEGKANARGPLKPGNYTVSVSGAEASGGAEFVIAEGSTDQTIHVPVEMVVLNATVVGPVDAAAGAELEVAWTGPSDKHDYITIVEKGAKNGRYLKYAYTRNGSPAKFAAPDGLGDYEIRYVHGSTKKTLASQPIILVKVEASLEAPAEIAAGAGVDVIWQGPNAKGDYVTIVEKGAKSGKYTSYAYTKNGSPAKIKAPDGLGVYELRYVFGISRRTLAARDITLTGVSGTLSVENTPVAGGEIVVAWTGPNYRGDYITLVEKGTPEGKYGNYAPTGRGSPLKFNVPKALGAFEVRYVLAKSKRTLVSIPIVLKAATATIEAPASVAAGSVVEITWSGPGGANDTIEIVPVGAKAGARPVSKARTTQGSPLSLFAPDDAGDYEVRYKMKSGGKVLAKSSLKVE
ncbi:MAG: VWA domain-containing protein [Rhizobiaceae bacterium]